MGSYVVGVSFLVGGGIAPSVTNMSSSNIARIVGRHSKRSATVSWRGGEYKYPLDLWKSSTQAQQAPPNAAGGRRGGTVCGCSRGKTQN